MEQWRALELTLHEGQPIRFGPDERDEANQIGELEFGTTQPGGFADATVVVPRPASLRADDAKLFADGRIYGPEGTDYEGRVTGVPQVGVNEVRLEFEGHVAHLGDDETFTALYADRDMSRWMGISRARRIVLLASNWLIYDHSTELDPSDGEPGVRLEFVDSWTSPRQPIVEAYFDAGAGSQIGAIYFEWAIAGDNPGHTNTSLQVSTCDDDGGTNGRDLSSDLFTAAGTSGTYDDDSLDNNRWAYIQWAFLVTPSGSADKRWGVSIKNPAIYGTHGLTKQGTEPAAGFFASDIIAHALSEGAPLLNHSPASIGQSDYVIPHAVYSDAGDTVQTVIETMSAYGPLNVPNDWGVYDGKEFFWLPPGTFGRAWRIRRDQVATPQGDGPDAQRRIAGIQIRYRDGAGSEFTVGPPGSNSDTETTDLLDANPDNPAHRIGKVISEDVGITNLEGAKLIGGLILRERNRLYWRGSIDVQGTARDEAGNEHPVSKMRAMDRVLVEDGDVVTEHTVNQTRYTHSGLQNTVTIGTPPEMAPVLLARLGLATDLLGL